MKIDTTLTFWKNNFRKTSECHKRTGGNKLPRSNVPRNWFEFFNSLALILVCVDSWIRLRFEIWNPIHENKNQTFDCGGKNIIWLVANDGVMGCNHFTSCHITIHPKRSKLTYLILNKHWQHNQNNHEANIKSRKIWWPNQNVRKQLVKLRTVRMIVADMWNRMNLLWWSSHRVWLENGFGSTVNQIGSVQSAYDLTKLIRRQTRHRRSRLPFFPDGDEA